MEKLAPELYEQAIDIERIGNRGVQNVLNENRKLGLPNVFSENGKIFYELPDGQITDTSPFKEELKK